MGLQIIYSNKKYPIKNQNKIHIQKKKKYNCILRYVWVGERERNVLNEFNQLLKCV